MDKKEKLDTLYENIENDRKILEDAARDLKSKIKDLSEHALGGQVLARYLDVLVKINDQLIEVEKLRIKADKENVVKQSSSECIKKELEEESLIGTAMKVN
jgi:hypothetical protein